MTNDTKVYVAVYLDTDTNKDDLLDNAGNPIAAGWYIYDWPHSWQPAAGPFETEELACAWRTMETS